MKKMLKVNMLRLLLGMSTLVFFGISGSFTAYAGDTPAAPQQHKRVVKGRVTDKKTGEPIVGATVHRDIFEEHIICVFYHFNLLS